MAGVISLNSVWSAERREVQVETNQDRAFRTVAQR